MTEITTHAPGTFCWVELGTPDAEAAKKFYGELFEWRALDTPDSQGNTYTMLRLDDKEVGALYQLRDEHLAQGIPPHWLCYISVANADEIAARAVSLGGTVILGPFDVAEYGRMAIINDPTGAIFAIWQPGMHNGAQRFGEVNTMCWHELATRDSKKAHHFYTQLFGWEAQTKDMCQTVYTSFSNNDQPIGGMLQMTEEWGDAPSHWMIYISVSDCDAAATKVSQLGGKVCVPPTDIPPVGRFAVIQDTQGATFSVIKLSS